MKCKVVCQVSFFVEPPASVPRLRCGECPGKRGGPHPRSRPSRHQEACPLDRPGRNLPDSVKYLMISILRLQLAPRICTQGLALSQFILISPSEGLPDSLRLRWRERAARRQGPVCVNDMRSCRPAVDSPRVDQWHAVCQSSPRGSLTGMWLWKQDFWHFQNPFFLTYLPLYGRLLTLCQ